MDREHWLYLKVRCTWSRRLKSLEVAEERKVADLLVRSVDTTAAYPGRDVHSNIGYL